MAGSQPADRRSMRNWPAGCWPGPRPRAPSCLGPDGLLSQETKAVPERALAEELTEHLGYEKHDAAERGSGNSRTVVGFGAG